MFFYRFSSFGWEREEMDGNDGTREKSEDSTRDMIVQMEEVMCVIRGMSFVTKLSPIGAHNRHGQG